MTDERMARTWAEIDLSALEHNYRTLERTARPAGLMGMVKADAYGHGALPVARKLQALGAAMLGVACLAEADELRAGGVSLPILCLGETPPELAPRLLELRVTQTVGDMDCARALSAAAVKAGGVLEIHLKVDTGMGRLGFVWCEGREEAALADMLAVCALPGLRVKGIFTHFSDADGSPEYTQLQLDRFRRSVEALEGRGISLEICHCASSAAVLHYPCTRFDLARPGIALYGYSPFAGEADGLRPVMAVKSRIAAVRELPAGAFVSYGRTARLERDSRIAVVPIGYGDGYPRCLSNGKGKVLLHGKLAPVVGLICMDQMMVDVSDIPQAAPGDVATLLGGGISYTEYADWCDTNRNECISILSRRPVRVYLQGGRIVTVLDSLLEERSDYA